MCRNDRPMENYLPTIYFYIPLKTISAESLVFVRSLNFKVPNSTANYLCVFGNASLHDVYKFNSDLQGYQSAIISERAFSMVQILSPKLICIYYYCPTENPLVVFNKFQIRKTIVYSIAVTPIKGGCIPHSVGSDLGPHFSQNSVP